MKETSYEQFYSITTYQGLMEMVRGLDGIICSDGIVMGNPSIEKPLTQYECRVRIGDEIVSLFAHVLDLTTQGGRPVEFSMSVYYVSKWSDD